MPIYSTVLTSQDGPPKQRFPTWLAEPAENNCNAVCRACNSIPVAGRNTLQQHALWAIHKGSAKQFQNITIVMMHGYCETRNTSKLGCETCWHQTSRVLLLGHVESMNTKSCRSYTTKSLNSITWWKTKCTSQSRPALRMAATVTFVMRKEATALSLYTKITKKQWKQHRP